MDQSNNTSKSSDYIKKRTIELYESLPQNLEERLKRTDIRDEVIELNYSFFGYIASKTFINNSSITYEDKFQSALLHFCECWWKWKWNGDETHRGYRSDLSFTVFFKLRVGEMIERELNEVKYSIRRSLCMEVGKQLGKHWGKVTYGDLSDPRLNLPADKMISLKAVFGTLYEANLEDHELYLPSDSSSIESFLENMNDNFNTIEELLIDEMCRTEEKLTEKKLLVMSDMYGIDIEVLKAKLPTAEQILFKKLRQAIDYQELLDS